jgi:aryl-alcohol dehydrogenase-like predicted oxidoreductase
MQTIPQRRLGSLTVGVLGLGCMSMAMVYGRPDPVQARAAIDRALELGVTLLDTADMYGRGASERLVGRALQGRRDQVVLASKVGIRSWPVVGIPRGFDGRPDYIRRSVEGSLRRLGTDHLDLYYLHRVDPGVPIEESVGALADLVRTGKVREIGVSEVTADELRRAYAVHPIAAVQSEWYLFSRELEAEVVPAARALGVGIVAYSPLGRGMLTGAASATTELSMFDYRRMLPRWRADNLAANVRAVDTVTAVAHEHGATPAQVALAWLLGQGDDVVPIPGTKRPGYVEENLGALGLALSDADRARLDGLVAAGDRYPRNSP